MASTMSVYIWDGDVQGVPEKYHSFTNSFIFQTERISLFCALCSYNRGSANPIENSIDVYIDRKNSPPPPQNIKSTMYVHTYLLRLKTVSCLAVFSGFLNVRPEL